MKKMRLLCICFIILAIMLLPGCDEIIPTVKPPPAEIGIFGTSRFGQAIFGSVNSEKLKIFRRENNNESN